jgi:hypothetical protein
MGALSVSGGRPVSTIRQITPRLIIGNTGATGIVYGIRALKMLRSSVSRHISLFPERVK